MQNRKRFFRISHAAAAVLMFAMATLATAQQVYDTSYAVEASYSCLTGGCHENNTQLVDEYSQSYMTHAMVKCNACHGTHTADTVGQEKPNLTGYQPGIGATGYIVGKDRCLTCHTSALTQNSHPSNPGECVSCHAPHVFAAGGK
ncbi:hypothetical protein [Thiohalomonas denitrificans]|uniref:Uncharacterized protein n=1 Tax=Thiohalomonas denitrificans TaxID=415747 RepID=A0A1G5Q8J8_9GAMM|nr:hypothetical protein [Thiohalomonas denitrificans]SCZ57948.1 hypothetical protein SAMN03097708_01555 [Thiohalomonas denitrificans]